MQERCGFCKNVRIRCAALPHPRCQHKAPLLQQEPAQLTSTKPYLQRVTAPTNWLCALPFLKSLLLEKETCITSVWQLKGQGSEARFWRLHSLPACNVPTHTTLRPECYGPSRKCHDRNNCFAMPPAGFSRHDQFGACLLSYSCTFRTPFCPIWLLFEMKLPRSALHFGKTYHFELDPFWPFGPAPGTWTRWNPQKARGSRFWTCPGVRVWDAHAKETL